MPRLCLHQPASIVTSNLYPTYLHPQQRSFLSIKRNFQDVCALDVVIYDTHFYNPAKPPPSPRLCSHESFALLPDSLILKTRK